MGHSGVQFFSMACCESALFHNKKPGNSEGKVQGNSKISLGFYFMQIASVLVSACWYFLSIAAG